MPFPTKGESHEIGVQNEKDIVKFLNENQNNAINNRLKGKNANQRCDWRQVGGTKHTEDAEATTTNDDGSTKVHKFSIKNHSKKGATFDYKNTTKDVPEPVKKEINNFKEEHHGKLTETNIKPLREELSDKLNSGFDSFDSTKIKGIISGIALEYPEHILVNDKKTKSLIMFGKDNLLNPETRPQDEKYILKKATARAKTSRQIWIQKSNGEEVNTHLRLRLTTNNGIKALLGHSKANKSSVVCIKIQQDKTDDFIESCSDKIIIHY